MSEHDKHFEQEGLQGWLGSQFKEDLSHLFGSNRKVPPEVDGAILFKAQKHFGRSWRKRLLRWVGSSAAAAVIIFAVLLNVTDRASYDSLPVAMNAVISDFDKSGRIDILDAFNLARQIESGAKVSLSYDFNTDGQVDKKDVDWLAGIAVRLDGGTEL